MEQEEIISYLQIVHQLWIEEILNEDEVCSYLDEINHDLSIVDSQNHSIKFIFKDNWYPTLVFIGKDGKLIVTNDIEDI
jgi:hypothetical protein